MLTFRRANINDTDLIFKWSNDPVTRSNSFNQNVIEYDSHVAWFAHKIADSRTCFLIFEEECESIGNVRIDVKQDENIIGITIAPDFRGKKMAVPMLIMACDYFFANFKQHIITAYIKEDNKASYKSFINAGFRETSLAEYFGAKSFKLIKQR